MQLAAPVEIIAPHHMPLLQWRERLPGGCYNWPPLEVPDPRAAEEMRPSEPAELTPLGRKLLGLDAW